MEQCKISNMYTLEETIAKDYLAQFTYPWEALAGIGDYIKELGKTLNLGGKIRYRGTDSMFKWSFNY